MKRNNKKGFTLAELLVVVAIIAVLVAVSVPVFSAQTKKANLATNQANARAAYAGATSDFLMNGYNTEKTYKYSVTSGAITTGAISGTSKTLPNTTDISSWTLDNGEDLLSDTYNSWYVTLTESGTVSKYECN